MNAYWAILIMIGGELCAQPQDCSLDVYVLAGAPVPAGMLPEAKKKVSAMFGEIGIKVRMWTGVPARAPRDTCRPPIVAQIESSGGYAGHPDALAYAEPYKKSGTCIHVFLDRVLQHMYRNEPYENTMLAHVLVHEITHVLEGTRRHSAQGMMKAEWSSEDCARMKRTRLPFSPADVELIRKALAKSVNQTIGE
jgi:hypothetical protein